MLTEEQIEQRLNYVTGSDAGIICGVSKYCTPYELWTYKTGRAVPEDISQKPAVKAGNMLEDAVRNWLSIELNKTILTHDGLIVHPDYPWMAGNVDGHVLGETAIVEIKTASTDSGWGDSGSDVIPNVYRLQIAHYMAITASVCCYVGVLIRGVDFRHYCIKRDIEIEKELIEREHKFWWHVQSDTPPPITEPSDIANYYSKWKEGSQIVADNKVF